MKSLAGGKNQTAILKLLTVTLNVAHSRLGGSKYLDDSELKEVADIHEFDTGTGEQQEEEGPSETPSIRG